MTHSYRKLAALALLMAVTLQAQPPPALPGTQPLEREGNITLQMLRGIDRFLERETEASVERRKRLWQRDFSSRQAYQASVEPNRTRFRQIIGLADERVRPVELRLDATTERPAQISQGAGYRVSLVRWPALEGVEAEGLLLEPLGRPTAQVVALPDADWTPEMLVGLQPGVEPESQFARRLAENECRVLVPVLIDRRDDWSGNLWPGNPRSLLTNLPHREMIFRMAFQLGRHLIGYEAQKVLAAVDWFKQQDPSLPVGVFGYGEGGLVAFYSAAADTRIDAAAVSGYFDSRQDLWQEPFYRHVWGLLEEFGDAEIASLIAPRRLLIEASAGPQVSGPGPGSRERSDNAAPGRLVSPELAGVGREVDRARVYFDGLGQGDRLSLIVSGVGQGPPGSEIALRRFLADLGARSQWIPAGAAPRDSRANADPDSRQRRQFDQLIDFTQRLMRRAEFVRAQFWKELDTSSLERWQQTSEPYRRAYWEEFIGRFPDPSEPLRVQSRLAYDEPLWTGYEVVIPVWPDVFAYGILLLPKDLREGERRPVVVCQHGVNRRVQYVVDPGEDNAYNHFAARLAERGFITFAPQNPYVGEPEFPFRQFQRKAQPLKRSIFSIVIGQHQRLLKWLSSLPYVDSGRIGFYGLSYGGETAVRVPPILPGYALAINSGNFNEWTWKTAGWDHHYSFLFRGGYDHFEFNAANTFGHAEAANLMAPRPFMVERGHRDGVGPDEWVAYEYAKVRRHYADLGIPERTEIEFFEGGHEIHAQGTFEFLHRHLDWPAPDGSGR